MSFTRPTGPRSQLTFVPRLAAGWLSVEAEPDLHSNSKTS